MTSTLIVPAIAAGTVLVSPEGLSFWGGVDPATGTVIDAHHPLRGASLAGTILMMPTSRGSCTGSGVLLELALNGHAPAALVFREGEDILTLGALIAGKMFARPLAVVRLDPADYDTLAATPTAEIGADRMVAGGREIPLAPLDPAGLALSDTDQAMLGGAEGPAARLAMEVIAVMAAAQGAERLTDITRAHIDGCIYASPANLTFAEAVADMGATIRVPTTMNAISVDYANWRTQGTPEAFGAPAARLADAYVRMGAQPTFTCAPYTLGGPPERDEPIAWAESNAVVYANSVLGARTVKHPDFLDLFIALTGRAPLAGVYRDADRAPRRVIRVALPAAFDDALWPMLGWLVGRLAPDRIPLVEGLEATAPSADDLKAFCAAFATTSAAPMLHIAGVTPEADLAPIAGAETVDVTPADIAGVWREFNGGDHEGGNDSDGPIDLVAFGSPHFSLAECRALAGLVAGKLCHPHTSAIVTLGHHALSGARCDGTLAILQAAGIKVVPDLCWCSISEPVFPPDARTVMTNSGKYAHYGPGLSGRTVRFGSLAACADAAVSGTRRPGLPHWLADAETAGT
ncbi:aconitase family protein [Acuticoccus sp. M5D2P5]|uniref:cis-3-hydroxy-L-proline dehydratase n=1 Tax=Acuticoccus kalidii TaxID=2910977 RepID=UPI001F2D2645|nr:aconitase family protein [Acuticoccus kalidii]